MKNFFRITSVVVAVVCTLCFSSLAVSAANYYAVGDFNAYTVDDVNTQMIPATDGSGTYSILVEDIAIAETADKNHAYKITDGTWNASGSWGIESYTLTPNPFPANPMNAILFSGTTERDVTFYFNADTKKVADSTYYTPVEPYIVGDFFNEMAIGTDWTPADSTLKLLDTNFDNIYTGSFVIPAGTYSFKTTIGKTWDLAYGVDGATTGLSGIPLVLANESYVTFTFNGTTHVTTFTIGSVPTPTPIPTVTLAPTPTVTVAPTSATSSSTTDDNPQTGDNNAFLLLTVLVLTLTITICTKMRRRHTN